MSDKNKKPQTLQEYLEQAQSMDQARKAEIAGQNAEIEELTAAIEENKGKAAAAVQNGDQAVYQKAMFDQEYCKARIQALKDHPSVFPLDDQAIIEKIKETRKLCRENQLKLFETVKASLEKIRDEMDRNEDCYDAILKIYSVYSKQNFMPQMERWLQVDIETMLNDYDGAAKEWRK